MKAKEITKLIETLAPLSLAASWDNSGWQIGSSEATVGGALLTVDFTPEVAEEAVAKGCNLVIAHHPLFFRPLSRLDLDTPRGRLVAETLRLGLNVYAAHTNLDHAEGGVNTALAQALGLGDVEILDPITPQTYKLAVFVPVDHAEAVKQAMGEAGAGLIGDYAFCFWQTSGTGQFRPLVGADPFIGQVGQLTQVPELRIEGVVEPDKLAAVLRAMLAAHPYEEVAYDLYPLANAVRKAGLGTWGCLPRPMTTAELVEHVKRSLGAPGVQVAPGGADVHEVVAVCGGSGASIMRRAASQVTAYVTADVKYHEAQEAAEIGLTVIDAGHYYTERPVLEALAARLRAAGMQPVVISEVITSPFAGQG